jgi:amylosucrase
MPGLLLKGEAIVGPDDLVQYLGGHSRYRPECDLAYDNQLMVMLWSALAARDARLPAQALRRRKQAPRQTTWVSYVRCHDDIGWAVSDEDAWALGLNPWEHRRFLASYYAGRHPGSFSRGLDFQPDPYSGEARTSGMAASLCGLETSLAAGSEADVEAALTRLETMYAVVYSFGGIPLVYMGDEVAQCNDPDWADDPDHADDNRWVHRPRMDWGAVERRTDPGTPEGRTFQALRRLGEVRASTAAFRSDADVRVLQHLNPRVLAYVRTHPRAAPVLGLACFSDDLETVDASVLHHAGIDAPVLLHSSTGTLDASDGQLRLAPWTFLWVTSAE